jgi:hypothetical protein
MSVRFSDLDIEDQQHIETHLRSFYDKVTFDTRTHWVMQFSQNDYDGFSSFDTWNYMDENQFEAIKLDLFLNGWNLFAVTKFGNVQLVSKRKYIQPKKWSTNEVINLCNTDDFEKMRINAEIIKIIQSEQSIELQETDFISWNRKIALVVNKLTDINLNLFDDCKGHVDHIILHFSGPNNIKIQLISEIVDKIRHYFMTSLTPIIGVCVNPELTEELVSIFLYYKKC